MYFGYDESMNVLFICNGNVARSQEAALFFNATSTIHHAKSSGVNVTIGKPMDPFVATVMDELGHSITGMFRKLTDQTLLDEADLVISFKPYDELPDIAQHHPNIRYWNIPDPRQQSIEFHREVRDNVKRKVDQLVAELET